MYILLRNTLRVTNLCSSQQSQQYIQMEMSFGLWCPKIKATELTLPRKGVDSQKITILSFQ